MPWRKACSDGLETDFGLAGSLLEPPGRHVGAPPQVEDCEPSEDKVSRLAAHLRERPAEGAKLDAAIANGLEMLGLWDR